MKRSALVLTALVALMFTSPSAAAAATRSLSSLRVSPVVFTPNADGTGSRAAAIYRLRRPAWVTVRVYLGTSVVKTLRLRRYTRTGRHVVRWNGISGSGTMAESGVYQFRVVARSGKNRSRSTRTVIVDTNPSPTQTPITTSTPTSPTTATVPGSGNPDTASSNRWVGYFVPGTPWQSMDPLTTLESKTAHPANVVMYYQAIVYQWDASWITKVVERGGTPMVTLEFWKPGGGANQPEYTLKRIAGGAFDSYLERYADSLKAVDHEVWIRPLHEMNGRWYPWSGTVNGNTPADFAAAWKHVRQVFLDRGVTNAKFVWSPNHESVPNTAENAIANYWPGNEYVDMVALDGYNWGTTQSWSRWKSFGEIFGAAYSTVTKLTSKPVMIGETGTTNIGGDKAAWIADMFQSITARYTQIQGVIWFNENKECDWRLDSDATSAAAFRVSAATFR